MPIKRQNEMDFENKETYPETSDILGKYKLEDEEDGIKDNIGSVSPNYEAKPYFAKRGE